MNTYIFWTIKCSALKGFWSSIWKIWSAVRKTWDEMSKKNRLEAFSRDWPKRKCINLRDVLIRDITRDLQLLKFKTRTKTWCNSFHSKCISFLVNFQFERLYIVLYYSRPGSSLEPFFNRAQIPEIFFW